MAEDSSNNRPEKRCKLSGGSVVLYGKEAPSIPIPVDLFSSLPQPCMTNIFNYAAASPDDVTDILSFISKQSRKDCLHESIVQKIVPTIYLSGRPRVRSSVYATRTILQKLKNHQFLMGNEKGQSHYKRMKVTGVNIFERMKISEARMITKGLSFGGIVSLDLSSLPSTEYHYNGSCEHVAFLEILLSMLPSLQEINLTNAIGLDSSRSPSFRCSGCLKKLTWNGLNGLGDYHDYSCGISLKQKIPNIKKMKDISIDDYTFYINVLFNRDSLNSLWNLDGSKKLQTIFSILRFAKKLERLSILNLRLGSPNHMCVFPQEALIKFVRCTLQPSVRWLRSDLSKANIDTLHLEYPNIEFVSS